MAASFSANHRWTRHFVYRRQRLTTTWKFRVGLLLFAIAVIWITSGWWTVAVARSLVCTANATPSDAILIENFDPYYLLFEHAATLRRAGMAPRVLVPVKADAETSQPDMVAGGTANLMASIAQLGTIEFVPTQEVEPISLNAARDILRFVQREQILSVIVVTPQLRSRRSALIYGAVLGQSGIRVACEPFNVYGNDEVWTHSLHGVQNVAEQWLKLQYYRFYVLRTYKLNKS